uniref:peptidylprolyl isomerase n=1 Tax=Haptolina brevifila TaxID=156173 RepID=A0A7S2DT47_9EUKA
MCDTNDAQSLCAPRSCSLVNMRHTFQLTVLLVCAATAAAESIEGYETTYKVESEGAGTRTVVKGSKVTVHATGVVEDNNYQFWSTKDAGQQPFKYNAGVGGVITGWDQGCLGMKIGEVRKLRIPAKEGYGARGFPVWKIPAEATLLFTIEVLEIDDSDKTEL